MGMSMGKRRSEKMAVLRFLATKAGGEEAHFRVTIGEVRVVVR